MLKDKFRAARAEILTNWKYIALGAVLGGVAGYCRSGAEGAIDSASLLSGTQTLCYALTGLLSRPRRNGPAL
jgi:hypothetical protein